MDIVVVISIINIALYLTLALLVLKVWKQGKAQRRFFFLMLVTGLWLLFVLLEYVLNYNLAIYKLLGKLDFSFASMVSLFFALFVFHLPKNNPKINILKEVIISIPSLLLILFIFTDVIFKYDNTGKALYNIPLYLVYILILFIYFVVIGATILIGKYKKYHGLEKLQLKYFILGYVITLIFLLSTSIYSALIYQIPDSILTLLCSFSMVFALTSAYSILRYRLMDIKLVIRRGIVHTLSLGIIITLYTVLVLLAQKYFNGGNTFITILAILIIALTIYPLRKWLFGTIDRLFYKNQIENEKRINGLLSQLSKVKEYEDIMKDIYDVVADKIKTSDVRVLFLDKEKGKFLTVYPSKAKKIELGWHDLLVDYLLNTNPVLIREEIPYQAKLTSGARAEELEQMESRMYNWKIQAATGLVCDKNVLGIVLIGQKQNKEAFTVQDTNFLHSLSRDAGLGLGNVLLYRETIEGLRRGIIRGEIG